MASLIQIGQIQPKSERELCEVIFARTLTQIYLNRLSENLSQKVIQGLREPLIFHNNFHLLDPCCIIHVKKGPCEVENPCQKRKERQKLHGRFKAVPVR